MHQIMRDYYFDDLKPGDAFSSPSLVLTEQDVIDFAKNTTHSRSTSIEMLRNPRILEG
jgi:hypothetical protein